MKCVVNLYCPQPSTAQNYQKFNLISNLQDLLVLQIKLGYVVSQDILPQVGFVLLDHQGASHR